MAILANLPQFEQQTAYMPVQFSEAGQRAPVLPEWCRFFLDLGWTWGSDRIGSRRIGLVTTPCDSAAAGLVGLGAVCCRLRVPGANDLERHFNRLVQLACQPGAELILRRQGRTGRFVVDGQYDAGMIWVRELESRRSTRLTVNLGSAGDWRVDGEAPVAIASGSAIGSETFYNALFPDRPPVVPSNLRYSDSSICLAGVNAGQERARRKFSDIRFAASNAECDLAHLLTVQQWRPESASRITYFNTLTGELDRHTRYPQLVIADGSAAFLKALAEENFSTADILGIVHRTADRDALESVGNRLSELLQWYEPFAAQTMPGRVPAGISAFVIQKRAR